MLALQGGLWTGAGREPQRLFPEIAPVCWSRGADRLAQGLGSDMAIALFDRHGIGVDDEIARLVLLGARERLGGRLCVGQHGGSIEVLAPASLGALKHDDAVRETVGGDNIGHAGLARWAHGAPRDNYIGYLTAKIYMSLCITSCLCARVL